MGRSSVPISGIYAIIHVKSGRWYVGQAQDIGLRWSSHRAFLKKGKHHCQHLQRSYDKYGPTAFAYMVVEKCSLSMLDEMEQWWMDMTPDLFNAQPQAGSARGYKHSEETRCKLRDAAIRVGTDPEERRRRSERARLQHASGGFGVHWTKR